MYGQPLVMIYYVVFIIYALPLLVVQLRRATTPKVVASNATWRFPSVGVGGLLFDGCVYGTEASKCAEDDGRALCMYTHHDGITMA